jgi:lipopolysaccharide/colanic/teichoic acid biosynthesis glycosyltransferase
MSMVGPRPVVREELLRYGSAASLYAEVKPGLTGLWQVSGRNNTSYRRRIEIDSQYIRSWTVAQDLVILIRVVLTGLGAS